VDCLEEIKGAEEGATAGRVEARVKAATRGWRTRPQLAILELLPGGDAARRGWWWRQCGGGGGGAALGI
jgi:hypothetical protein